MSGDCRVSVVCVEDQESGNTKITAATTPTDGTTFATDATITTGTTSITAGATTTSIDAGGSSDATIASVCVCLVCDKHVKEASASHLQQLLHGSGSSTSHPLQPPLAPLLEEAIKTPLQQHEIELHRLCRRCFRLLEELDGLRQRSEVIKNSLSTWYNKSLLRRLNLQTAEDVILKSVEPESGSLATNNQTENVAEPSICLKEEAVSDEEAENVFQFEEEEEEELRPEDQGIRPDDPEFNPAYDNAWLVGRGRRGRGRGPGRPPKNAKDVLPEAVAGESLGEKLGELVTKMLEGEEEEEEENEQVLPRREDILEIKKEQGEREDKDDQENSEERPSKVTRTFVTHYPCLCCTFSSLTSQSLRSL